MGHTDETHTAARDATHTAVVAAVRNTAPLANFDEYLHADEAADEVSS